jgi:hypothetical protein
MLSIVKVENIDEVKLELGLQKVVIVEKWLLVKSW